MAFSKTKFEGLLLFEPQVFEDNRGYFFEAFNEKVFEQEGIDVHFVQDNQSSSGFGVIRGLHFQSPPYAQQKLVRVIRGKILDVAVDIRKGSSTYGKSYTKVLSAKNKRQLFIPKGFAHGFSVLSKNAVVLYKCDEFYNKESEGGIIYNDPALKIDWRIVDEKAVVSEKDMQLPTLANCLHHFEFK